MKRNKTGKLAQQPTQIKAKTHPAAEMPTKQCKSRSPHLYQAARSCVAGSVRERQDLICDGRKGEAFGLSQTSHNFLGISTERTYTKDMMGEESHECNPRAHLRAALGTKPKGMLLLRSFEFSMLRLHLTKLTSLNSNICSSFLSGPNYWHSTQMGLNVSYWLNDDITSVLEYCTVKENLKRHGSQAGMVHTYSPSSWGAEAGRIGASSRPA